MVNNKNVQGNASPTLKKKNASPTKKPKKTPKKSGKKGSKK